MARLKYVLIYLSSSIVIPVRLWKRPAVYSPGNSQSIAVISIKKASFSIVDLQKNKQSLPLI
ncbi:hypothetical protein ACEQPO_26045 [Bacillus sp. SL00103]